MIETIKEKYITTFFFILMCIQYVPIEGAEVSYIKFGTMCLSPIIWIFYSPKITRAFAWGSLYFATVFFSCIFNAESFRLSTIGYLFSFICMFIMFYNLIYFEKAFTIDSFICLIKRLILAYTICLILQQIFKLLGHVPVPLINLNHIETRTLLGANSLAIEQSHSARIMTALFLGLLRMYEVKWGKDNVTIQNILTDSKWVLAGFLWSMITMGSGTAFVGLGILSLYFIKQQYALTIIPLLFISYAILPYINYQPIQRTNNLLNATLTMNQKTMIHADGSGASRIFPLINTIKGLDITDKNTWLGKGIDTGKSFGFLKSEGQLLGGITDYGLISYICSLFFLFKCCIRKVFSLESLVFIVMLGAGITNIAFVWGILMIFTTSRYFLQHAELCNEQLLNK
jgi:hypothetical protein